MGYRKKHASIFFTQGMEAQAEMAWRPSADVYRTREGWLVKLDLAGVRPQDVSVTWQGSRLQVTGVRRDWVIEEGWSYHTMEITYSRFERTIDLPSDLTQAEISVECREGMLLLRVTAKEDGKGEGQ